MRIGVSFAEPPARPHVPLGQGRRVCYTTAQVATQRTSFLRYMWAQKRTQTFAQLMSLIVLAVAFGAQVLGLSSSVHVFLMGTSYGLLFANLIDQVVDFTKRRRQLARRPSDLIDEWVKDPRHRAQLDADLDAARRKEGRS